MKTFIAVLCLAVLAQCNVVPENGHAGQEQNGITQLNNLIEQARSNIDNLAKQIQEQMNLPSQETVVNVVKEQSNNFVHTVQDYMKNITEQIQEKNPELERLWTDVKGKLNKVVEDITSGIPNAQEQAAELQAKFQEGVQVLVKESDNAVKSLNENSGKLKEDIAKFTKQAVDIAVEATQSMNNQLQQVAHAGH